MIGVVGVQLVGFPVQGRRGRDFTTQGAGPNGEGDNFRRGQKDPSITPFLHNRRGSCTEPTDAKMLAVGVAELVGVTEEITVDSPFLAGAGKGDIDLGTAIAITDGIAGIHPRSRLRCRGGGVVQAVADPVGDRIGRIVGPDPGGGGGCSDGERAELDGIAQFLGGAVGGNAVALQGPLAVLVDQGEDEVGGRGGHPGTECGRGVRSQEAGQGVIPGAAEDPHMGAGADARAGEDLADPIVVQVGGGEGDPAGEPGRVGVEAGQDGPGPGLDGLDMGGSPLTGGGEDRRIAVLREAQGHFHGSPVGVAVGAQGSDRFARRGEEAHRAGHAAARPGDDAARSVADVAGGDRHAVGGAGEGQEGGNHCLGGPIEHDDMRGARG